MQVCEYVWLCVCVCVRVLRSVRVRKYMWFSVCVCMWVCEYVFAVYVCA